MPESGSYDVGKQPNLITQASSDISSLQVKLVSKPVELDSQLKCKHEQVNETSKSSKISKLVDQFRVLCKQPTSEEMKKEGTPNFRRRVT